MSTRTRSLIYSSKTDTRDNIQTLDKDPNVEKLMYVIFTDRNSHKRLVINRYGYRYHPSNEYKSFVAKFKNKK